MYMSGRNLHDGVAVSCFANGLNLTKVLCPISMLLDSSGVTLVEMILKDDNWF